jgi:hypothetical protein
MTNKYYKYFHMKKLFFLYTLFFAVFTIAQTKKLNPIEKSSKNNGYNIIITTENTSDAYVYLKLFNGTIKSGAYTLDSAKIVKLHQKIVFKKVNTIASFPVLFTTKDQTNSVMLFLKNGINLNINLEGNKLENISVDEALNKDFLVYQREKDNDKKILLANEMLKNYPESGVQTFFNFELVRLQAKDKSKVESALKNAEKSMNFSDKIIPILPNSYVFLNEYFNNSANYYSAVDSVLKNLDCKSANYKFYIDWMQKNLEYKTSSAQDPKEDYQYIVKNYLDKPECQTIFSKDIDKMNFLIKESEMVPLGKPLPDFKVKDISGKFFDFNQYLKENKNITIIIFFDPDCPHCIENTPKKVAQVEAIEKQLHVKFNKIALMYIGVESEWPRFIKNAHLENWLNVTSGDKEKSIPNILPITGTPTYFILDKDGNLLVKDLNEQLLKYEVSKERN